MAAATAVVFVVFVVVAVVSFGHACQGKIKLGECAPKTVELQTNLAMVLRAGGQLNDMEEVHRLLNENLQKCLTAQF